MNMSEAGLAVLREFEGLRTSVYLDTAGLRTIGFGHRLRAGETFPNGLTAAAAEQLLAADVDEAEQAVRRLVDVPLSQGQFDALVDFTYNLGADRLEKSTLLRNLNDGKYAAAAGQILLWDHCGHVELDGLKRRREAEFKLFAKVD